MTHMQKFCVSIFLSTLSLRRATRRPGQTAKANKDFYPRSPCGERPTDMAKRLIEFRISIHALLAESDIGYTVNFHAKARFLSTLSLRRATIHTARKGSGNKGFLSTLSLRRATPHCPERQWQQGISIHALLAESDIPNSGTFRSTHNFYPRSPCGERLFFSCFWCIFYLYISIHALLAESDIPNSGTFRSTHNFYPRSPCGERRVNTNRDFIGIEFLSTLSLRRATCLTCLLGIG